MAIQTDNDTTTNESLLITSVLAGLGGILLSLCTLAAASATSPNLSIVKLGHVTAIIMYFFISAVLCIGMNEKRRKEAFILGIAAPAIITSMAAGVGGNIDDNIPESAFNFSIISVANAAQESSDKNLEDSQFWTDFKRGIGFQVDKQEWQSRAYSLQSKVEKLESEQQTISKEIEGIIIERNDALAYAEVANAENLRLKRQINENKIAPKDSSNEANLNNCNLDDLLELSDEETTRFIKNHPSCQSNDLATSNENDSEINSLILGIKIKGFLYNTNPLMFRASYNENRFLSIENRIYTEDLTCSAFRADKLLLLARLNKRDFGLFSVVTPYMLRLMYVDLMWFTKHKYAQCLSDEEVQEIDMLIRRSIEIDL
ncbi:hypothetical protein [Alteromonas gracilis]|uniref:hypothetical protein n=1 Tax=Alteromonas gracilis TaxID=1479524 RepID=UPI0037355CCF